MKQSLLLCLLILSISIIHTMDLVTYTTIKDTPNRLEQALTQKKLELVDLNEEIYKRYSQNKKIEAQRLLSKTAINALFIYGIQIKRDPDFIKWLLGTENANVHFYPIKAILSTARLYPHDEIIKLLEDHITSHESTQRKVILEKSETPKCECIIL